MYKNIILLREFVFENTRTGVIHLHAYWKLSLPGRFSSAGLVSDIAKAWLSAMPAKYQDFKPLCIYHFDEDNTTCYKVPSCKITLRQNQPDRETEWRDYLRKTII